MKAYVASPLGFSEAGRLFYYDKLLPMIKAIGIEILDPWVLTPQSLIDSALVLPYGEQQKKRWQELNQVIGENNEKAIEECDILVGVLDGTDVDSGTASEIGYAAGLGAMIEGYRGDFRLSADNVGSTVNLQVEHFIRRGGGIISSDLATLEKRLKQRYLESSSDPTH
jgi:nucleoside 2-deoxyribosyltransferase